MTYQRRYVAGLHRWQAFIVCAAGFVTMFSAVALAIYFRWMNRKGEIMSEGWIGVDLDGTLAHYDGWKGVDHIGEPVPAMLQRVRDWIEAGQEVRIFTARVAGQPKEAENAREYINAWLWHHGLIAHGEPIPVTNVKDFQMLALWDDRAVQVEINTGLAYVHPHGVPTP